MKFILTLAPAVLVLGGAMLLLVQVSKMLATIPHIGG